MSDAVPKKLARRYQREVGHRDGHLRGVMLFWKRLLDMVDAVWLKWLVALFPALLVCWVMRAFVRYVRDSDEMQRRIELESGSISAMLLAPLPGRGLFAERQADPGAGLAGADRRVPALCLLYGVIKDRRGAALPVNNRLRELREARGWSQGALAEQLEVSRQTVNALETGKYDPSLPLAFRIARMFGESIEQILHLRAALSEDPNEPQPTFRPAAILLLAFLGYRHFHKPPAKAAPAPASAADSSPTANPAVGAAGNAPAAITRPLRQARLHALHAGAGVRHADRGGAVHHDEGAGEPRRAERPADRAGDRLAAGAQRGHARPDVLHRRRPRPVGAGLLPGHRARLRRAAQEARRDPGRPARTGRSNKLVCKDSEGKSAVMDTKEGFELSAAKDFAARCAAKLARTADLRFYSTTDAIQDLEAVRLALGAPSVNLMGVSYGTRVAQQYAKRYPQHTRTVTIDGIVPDSLVLGNEHARNLERSLDSQFQRCALSPGCTQKLGDPRKQLDALMAKLKTDPPLVTYRDAITGETKQERLTPGHVAMLARMFAYAPQIAGLLPLELNEAAQGRYEPLMALSTLLNATIGDSIMHGMQLSVICTEDATELKADPADAGSLIGVDHDHHADRAVRGLAAWRAPGGFPRAAHRQGAGAGPVGRIRPGHAAALRRRSAQDPAQRPPPGGARPGPQRAAVGCLPSCSPASSTPPRRSRSMPNAWTPCPTRCPSPGFTGGSPEMIEVRDLHKTFPSKTGPVQRGAGRELQRPRRRDHRPARPQRRRQDHHLRMLYTLMRRTRRVSVDGFDCVRDAEAVRRRLGVLPTRAASTSA
jgi:DNA-binding XRE family transcriptional regulator/pimeloyl-ACP methyl ester carboxylesterase